MRSRYWTTERQARIFIWSQGMVFIGSIALVLHGNSFFWFSTVVSLVAGLVAVFYMD